MATNFSMYSGDTRRVRVTVVDTNGDPVDLTGSSITWSLSSDSTATGSQAITYTLSDNVALIDAVNGIFEVTIVPAATASITGDKRYHEAELTESDGTVTTVMTGTITIKDDLVA